MYNQIDANKRKTVLIMFVFFVFVAAVAWLITRLYGNSSLTIFILLFSVGYAVWSYFASDKLALTLNRAQQIEKRDNPRLWRIVENLSITDGLPMPRVYIIDDPAPNAFATGRDPAHSAVAVTSGLLEIMNDNELEGVIAHEIGHVKNYDIRVSMVAFGLVIIVSMLCDFFLRMSFWGSMSGDGDNDSNNSSLQFLGLIALFLAPIVATLLQLAISRKREFLADATGALTTRYPEGLESALSKIELYGSTMRRQNTSTAHLFFANPLKKRLFANLLSTHPPIEERIARLKAMDNIPSKE